ncbi:hypothetical protein BP6252_10776 [Coleophoma cylindrospora]|uniref:Peptidase S33 tripeptidyl aminopeptidase-like C-terminal domain-containing protein n=1 Tax=Coleophoma cylindrospora TaxID=1849047 RepID=A0A3D8QTL8_9HELO|nr:hypothetical protein BP6252_10776 [Coleophoma cylindrospora]
MDRPKIKANLTQSHPKRCCYSIVLGLALLLLIFSDVNSTLFTRIKSINFFPTAFLVVEEDFRWSNINATEYMNYIPCFGKYECALLDVPMDWNAPDSNPSRVSLAVIRLPAKVPVTDPRYGGAILINPGGPSGSGIKLLTLSGNEIATVVDSEISVSDSVSRPEAKYFDIVSFDPRGVNNTQPHLKCFPGSFPSDVWGYQVEAEGIPGSSSVAISNAWARSKALAAGCSQDNEIIEHMNTVAVVADMVQIIEKHGEWRQKQANLWLSSKAGKIITDGKGIGEIYSRKAIIERTKWRQGQEKLQYWGFSYGTVLGSTFASLHPDRSERVAIDGVVNATDYYQTAWLTNLQDTDKIIDKFYDYCHLAGPGKCSLNTGNSTPADIEILVEDLLTRLQEDPISVQASMTRGPEIITYSDVMMLIRVTLYEPFIKFAPMADLLADVVHGNGSAFADYKQHGRTPNCPLDHCKSSAPYADSCQPMTGSETMSGIMCSDGDDVSNHTKEQFQENFAALYNQSKWLGAYWSLYAMRCAHWKGRAKWRVTGDDIRGNTSHPILMLSTTLDPVTPLANAHAMSKRFPGSVVLELNAEGHCSISAPSVCAAKHTRAYFQTGQMPPQGTICQQEELPLIGKTIHTNQALSAEDNNLLVALKHIAKSNIYQFL